MKIMTKLKYWIPSFIFALVIFFLSSRPRITITQKTFLDFVLFKSLHMIEYGLFLILNYRAVVNTFSKDKYKAGKIALFITILYALTDEYHQRFVPTREGKLRDVIFDTIGASLALFYLWNLLPKAPRKLLIWAKELEII